MLLQHGILDSSITWMAFPDALAYVLFNAGYDVWLGNNRGNTYSHKWHKEGDTSSKVIWQNFSSLFGAFIRLEFCFTFRLSILVFTVEELVYFVVSLLDIGEQRIAIGNTPGKKWVDMTFLRWLTLSLKKMEAKRLPMLVILKELLSFLLD